MHKYLRAIGFSQIVKRNQIEELMKYVVMNSSERIFTSHDDEFMFAEYSKDFAENVGLIVRGEFDEENNFYQDFYYPYLKGLGVWGNFLKIPPRTFYYITFSILRRVLFFGGRNRGAERSIRLREHLFPQ